MQKWLRSKPCDVNVTPLSKVLLE